MKIRAFGKDTRIPMSLSNYIFTNDGCEADRKRFTEIVKSQPFDAGRIAGALNREPGALYRFTAAQQTESTILLEARDGMGNTDIIKITKE